MGWTFHYHTTKDQLIRSLLEPRVYIRDNGTPVRIEPLRHTVRGTHLWSLWQELIGDQATRYIVLHLLAADRKHDGYGYKDMDETMHPYYYDCPVTWLDDLTEPENDGSREWRAKVREWHAHEKAHKRRVEAMQPGEQILVYGVPYTYEYCFRPGRYAVRKTETGVLYGATRSMITFPEG